MIYSICLLSLNSIPPEVDTSKRRYLLESLRLGYFLKHYRETQIKLCLFLTLMWNFRKGASPGRALKSFQNLNSATFETMNTEKLDLKPQH